MKHSLVMKLALVVGLLFSEGQAQANPILLDTSLHPSGPSSNLNISLNIAGLQTININGIALSGNALTRYNPWSLPANSGQVEVLPTGIINLSNVTSNFGGFLSPLVGNVSTSGVSSQLTLGPVGVTNRNFTINNTTAGGLNLNSGTLVLNLTGGTLLGLVGGPQTVNLNLGTSPFNLAFSGLSNSIAATTDADTAGLDPDGAELNIPLNISSTIQVQLNPTTTLPVTVTTTGFVRLGSSQIVPEPSSAMLVAFVGLAAGFVRRRCKVA